MALKKKTTTAKAAPSSSKETSASAKNGKITVVKIFGEDGELNTAGTETIETVALPEGAAIGHLSITKGVGADYGKLKASVQINVPYVLGEEAEAATYASAKVNEILDEIGAEVAEAGEGDTKSSKDADEDEDEDAEGDDDGDEDGDDEGDLTEEDIDAMDRAQLVDFLESYGQECEEAGEENPLEDIDPDDFKKTKAGLVEFKDAVKEALFAEGDEDEDEDEEGEGYTAEELEELDTDELKAIFKENNLGKYPKNDKLARKAILAAQEEGDDD